jgi:GPH family glycoside/pentoside/hexuronide:cation symporter
MPLPGSVIFAYASVSFTGDLLSTLWGLVSLHYLTDSVGLEPYWTGILILLYRTWDALNDVIVGHMSDTTKSERWGRRRGFMLFGLFPYLISYVAFWYVPWKDTIFAIESSELLDVHLLRQMLLFLWYAFLLGTCDLGFTCVNVGYMSLLGELTVDPNEKYQISLWRSIGLGAGSLVSMLALGIITLPSVERELFDGVHMGGWHYLTITFAVLYAISVLLCIWKTRGIDVTLGKAQVVKDVHWTRFFRRAWFLLKIKEVRLGVLVHMACTTAVQYTISVLSYFFLNYLRVDVSQMALVVLTAVGSGVLSGISVKAFFSQVEKHVLLRNGLGVWAVFYVILPFIQEYSWRVYPVSVLMGIGLGISLVVPVALITVTRFLYSQDISDVVEVKTGERGDGLLLGLREFFNKILLGFMILALELALQFTGFEKGEPLTPASTWVIKGSLLLPLLLLYLAFWANARI